jgi:hypothetical protein
LNDDDISATLAAALAEIKMLNRGGFVSAYPTLLASAKP